MSREKLYEWINELSKGKNAPLLEGDANILKEAFLELSKHGVDRDDRVTLESIDELLKDASIQLQKNGDAIIVDSNGKVTTVKSR